MISRKRDGIASECSGRSFVSAASSLIVENYFQYIPNLGAAIFFAVVFTLITVGTIVHSIRFRSGYMWVMAVGTTCIFIPCKADFRDGYWLQFPGKGAFQSICFSRLSHQPNLYRTSPAPETLHLSKGSCADLLPRHELCHFWPLASFDYCP